MDVRENRNIDKVIVLGSGESILELSEQEKDLINRCKMVISVNKFMAFYKEAGIIPTHVYFVDRHNNSLLFLRHILEMCKRDGLRGLTFIFHRSMKLRVYQSKLRKIINQSLLFIYYGLRFLRRWRREFLVEMVDTRKALNIKNNNAYEYQFIRDTLSTEGEVWQKSLRKKLFHFRGSLSAVLNYVSIISPETAIYLVGTDFYGPNYFFEKELEELEFEWKDWTYSIVKEGKRHISFQDYKGLKMTDKFPFIMESLEGTGNPLYCVNPNSLLVKEAGVPFKVLIPDNVK